MCRQFTFPLSQTYVMCPLFTLAVTQTHQDNEEIVDHLTAIVFYVFLPLHRNTRASGARQ